MRVIRWRSKSAVRRGIARLLRALMTHSPAKWCRQRGTLSLAPPGPLPNPIWSLPEVSAMRRFCRWRFLGTHYGDATVSEEGATPETAGRKYQVSSTSQYAGVPFLLSKRSMAVLGECVSYVNFSVDNGEDFSVTSASRDRSGSRGRWG